MHAGGCVASLRSAGRHKWRPYVWRRVVWRRFGRRVGIGVVVIIRHVRGGDIHVARVADACMRRLRYLPAVGRASQVAPLRVVAVCAAVWRGGGEMAAARGGGWDKRGGDIHVARMADACMHAAVVLPPCGRPGVTSGAPTCGRFVRRVGGGLYVVWRRVCGGSGGGGGSGVTSGAPTCGRFGGGSGGVVCVVCGQSWLRLIFPLMRKRATMWALGMTMSPA